MLACNPPTRDVADSKAYSQDSPSSDIFMPIITRSGEKCPQLSTIETPDGIASWSSPIAVSPQDGSIWVVNPDSGSVSIIDSTNLEKVTEIQIGQEPWAIVISSGGTRGYVLDRATGLLSVINTETFSVCATLSIGPEPQGIALSPTGSRAFITGQSAAELVVVNTASLEVVDRFDMGPNPHSVAVTDDGDGEDVDEQVYITHFLARQRPGGEEATDDGREGFVTIFDIASESIDTEIVLEPDSNGFPNLLSSIAIFENSAWIPHVRHMPASPNTLTKVAFAVVTTLDLNTNSEYVAAHLPLNDQEIFGSPVNNPVAAVPSPDGNKLYIVMAGSDLVEVVDISDPEEPQLVKFLQTGSNPRGITLSPNGRFGYVMNYLSRSITVLDLEQLQVITEIPVTSETLDAEHLQGKILFNYAVDPRLSTGSWISCASCHPDGGTDGITWIFPDGPRQTPPLWNSSDTGPLHWSAALDELQDVEITIEIIQHGLGLAPGTDANLRSTPNANRAGE
ncbi:MAG: hypothetical protein DWQ04_23755, partial [Chloroflexi bacterium]